MRKMAPALRLVRDAGPLGVLHHKILPYTTLGPKGGPYNTGVRCQAAVSGVPFPYQTSMPPVAWK